MVKFLTQLRCLTWLQCNGQRYINCCLTSFIKQLSSMIMMRDELAATIGPDNKIYAVGGYGGPDK